MWCLNKKLAFLSVFVSLDPKQVFYIFIQRIFSVDFVRPFFMIINSSDE